MKNKNAFTLIEVMVVLSILAIIAILSYNFFGGTMKEAMLKQGSTKIFNDMRILSDATEKYYMDNSSYPADVDALVTAGIIKAVPTPPKGCWDGAGASAYQFYDPYGDLDNLADVDDVAIDVTNINGDCATAFNDAYTSISGGPFDYVGATNTYPGASYAYYAIDLASTPTVDNKVIWVVEYRH